MPYNSDPQRIAARANALRAQLIHDLGGACAECGSTSDLEINHIYGRSWTPRKLTHYRRVLRYVREAREGLINVLCSECNKRYRPQAEPPQARQCHTERPF